MFALHQSVKVLVKLFQKLAGLGSAHKNGAHVLLNISININLIFILTQKNKNRNSFFRIAVYFWYL